MSACVCVDCVQVDDYDFCRFMSSESELLAWKAEGLPGDSLSGQNAVVILNAAPMAPLVIDPSTQVRTDLCVCLRVCLAVLTYVYVWRIPRFCLHVCVCVCV